MAYYSGTASTLADLRTALLTHAQSDGWTLTGDVLSKAGVYFQITVDAENIKCLGCESNAIANPAPGVVMIGTIWKQTGKTTRLISFPCNYHVFGFAQELYLVVNYDVERYQWMAFGKTSVPGIPGQGGWCGATTGSYIAWSSSYYLNDYVSQISPSEGGSSYGCNCPGMFWATYSGNYSSYRNCWVNSGLDSHGWTWNGTTTDTPIGIRHISTLLTTQPSVWNSEAVLLPLRAYKQRPSYKASLVADLDNARILRIDNLTPGDILTIGSDKWKIFPWYIKNSTYRNGPVDQVLGSNLDHSGTLGWAIRYEGP